MGDPHDRIAFILDYKITACSGILRWFYECYERGGYSKIVGKREEGKNDASASAAATGIIDIGVVFFAVEHCKEFVKGRQQRDFKEEELGHHSSINRKNRENYILSDAWASFLEDYYKLVNQGKKIKVCN